MGGVLSKETAADQLKVLTDHYEFDIEVLPPKLKPAIEASLRQIEKGIMAGRLEVQIGAGADDCSVTQHLFRPAQGMPNPIVYGEVTGRCKIGIRDDGTDYGKIYAFLAALCGENAMVFQKMRGQDLSLAEALGAFFLQV